ncbi:MAG: alpha/beta fold hydrolase [Gemmataceae bacterium]
MRFFVIVPTILLASLTVFQLDAADNERIAKPNAPFAVKVTGKGRPIIFIPGLACSGAVWDSAVDHYKDQYECHVLTLAGFAGQPPLKIKGRYLETIRKSIAEYIKDKKLDKPVIVGHSLGGYLLFFLAGSEPDLVGPVIAVDGFPCIMAAFGEKSDETNLKKLAEAREKQLADMPHDQFLKNQKDFFAGWFTDKDKLEKVHSWISDSDQATVARAMGEVMGGDARPGLAKTKSPILLIGAYSKDLERFGVKREDYEKRCTDQISKAPYHKFIVTTESKHFIMYDQPKWLWEQIDAFLKESNE